jgi:phage terminase large subunit
MRLAIPKAYKTLFTPARYKIFYGGRGSAKSESYARTLLVQGMQERHLVLCTREFQASIQDSVHRLLASTIMNNNLSDEYEILQSTIRHRKNGTEFIFKGLRHNITEIKGLQGVTRVWCEEAENISDRSWEVLIPTIRAPGSEIWVSFNPKNPNDPTYQRFVANPPDQAIVQKVSWRDNPFFPEILRQEMQSLKDKDPEAADHIWEGGFDTRRSGAVYAKQLQKARDEARITRVPYDPSTEVFTAWDLGFGDATAIWFLQFIGRELRWLDYYENSGEQLDHYTQIVKQKSYNYMKMGHFLPHDGGHGNIRGDSVSKQLFDMGLQNTVLTRETDINPGIELLRQTIAYSVFDADKCKEGIRCLENYAYEWDDERKVFKSKPAHNWTSHGADSARYAAIAASMTKAGLTTKKPDPFAVQSYGSSYMAY